MRGIAKVLLAAAAIAIGGPAHSEPVKVGIIAPFSGPFSLFGESWKQGIEAFRAIHGKTVDGQDVELVLRDLTGPNPAEAKAIAQELVIKEKVQYIGGIVFTPNALAIAPVIEEAKIPTVIFNAATSSILEKSKYFVRVSYTLPQITVPIANFVREQGVGEVVTMVSDYAPGVEAETAFVKTFEAAGGKVVEKIRVPLKTTDFGPFFQRVKGTSAKALFMFFPGGPPSFGAIKAYNDNGLRDAGIRLFGTSEADERDLPTLGEAALGLETGMFYSGAHDSSENRKMLASLKTVAPAAVANASLVEAYDGMTVLYRMIGATKGARDPEAAMKAARGYAWESPRGPVRIDADMRHIIQNVYMRKLEKDGEGKLVHREFKVFEQQPDHGRTP